MARLTDDHDPPRIRLDRAFRWVLVCMEMADGVDSSHRLGLFPGQTEPDEDPRGRPAATGPEFTRRFSSAPQPRRKGLPPLPPPRATVPRVPDSDHLDAMLQDQRDRSAQTQPEEQRVCRVHSWLLKALTCGQIDAWADVWIQPRDGGEPILCERAAQIDAGGWHRLMIDYVRAEASSPEWDHPVELGTTIFGRQQFGDLHLNRIQLSEELTKICKLDLPVSIEVATGEDTVDRCVVCWEGESCTIQLKRKPQISRGMHALAILLRNPDRGVAYHLLDGGPHSDAVTRVSDVYRSQLAELRKEIYPLAAGLFKQELSLDDAHQTLDTILVQAKYEGPSLRGWAHWSPHYGGRVPNNSHQLSAAVKKRA